MYRETASRRDAFCRTFQRPFLHDRIVDYARHDVSKASKDVLCTFVKIGRLLSFGFYVVARVLAACGARSRADRARGAQSRCCCRAAGDCNPLHSAAKPTASPSLAQPPSVLSVVTSRQALRLAACGARVARPNGRRTQPPTRATATQTHTWRNMKSEGRDCHRGGKKRNTTTDRDRRMEEHTKKGNSWQ